MIEHRPQGFVEPVSYSNQHVGVEAPDEPQVARGGSRRSGSRAHVLLVPTSQVCVCCDWMDLRREGSGLRRGLSVQLCIVIQYGRSDGHRCAKAVLGRIYGPDTASARPVVVVPLGPRLTALGCRPRAPVLLYF